MDKVQSDFDKLRLALAEELGPDWYMAQASQQALVAYATAPAEHSLRERRNIETAAVNQAFRVIRAGLAAGLVLLPPEE